MMRAVPRVVIALAHDLDVERWRERFARGEVLDETPYGYHRAAERFELAWTVSHRESRSVARARRALAARLGFDLVHIWRNRRLLRSADAIWTHTEREHLAVAAVVSSGGPPVLAQSVWLWDAWRGYGALRRAVVARLLRRHRIEVVHSSVNLADARAAVPGRRVELLPFGSAGLPSVREVEPPPRPSALAVGNDADRDWPLLAAAARRLPAVSFRVVSGSRAARDVAWPVNVDLTRTATRESLAAWMAQSRCVVVPLRPNRHASGTTSCIEAMSAGRPMVVSSAGGLQEYVEGAARLVEPGDLDELVRGIEDAVAGIVAGPPGAAQRDRGLTQRDYVGRYALVTAWMLGGSWDPAVSAFAPVEAGVTPAGAP